MKYKEAINYLDSFFNYERIPRYNYSRELKLERMKELLSFFDNPQSRFKSIHIAGSKGKGTVAASLYQVFKKGGYNVGLYTSPHLLSIRERIRLSLNRTDDPLNFSDTIGEEEFCALIDYAKPHLDEFSVKSKWGRPTFFEVYTLLAFLYFAEKKVDLAILETGLGGRLDATNVTNPVLTIITKLLFEHTDKLGNTIKSIAYEKAGILKDKIPCILGYQSWGDAYSVIKQESAKKNVPLFVVGEGIHFNGNRDCFSVTVLGKKYSNLNTNLNGEFQIENLTITVAAVELLKEKFPVNESDLRFALSNVSWPGRFEIVSENPKVILDVAHTPESVKILGRELKISFSGIKINTIVGISRDKAKEEILKEIAQFSSRIIVTEADNPRATKKEELKEAALKVGIAEDILDVIEIKDLFPFQSRIRENEIILITGSVFLIADYLKNRTKYQCGNQNYQV